MFTIYYKGFYINGYIDRPECRVVHDTITPRPCKSIRAAKIWITRHKAKEAAAVAQMIANL